MSSMSAVWLLIQIMVMEKRDELMAYDQVNMSQIHQEMTQFVHRKTYVWYHICQVYQ